MYLLEDNFPQKDKHNCILKLGKSYSRDLKKDKATTAIILVHPLQLIVCKKQIIWGVTTKNPQQKNPGHVHTHKAAMMGDSSVAEQQDILSRLILIYLVCFM